MPTSIKYIERTRIVCVVGSYIHYTRGLERYIAIVGDNIYR